MCKNSFIPYVNGVYEGLTLEERNALFNGCGSDKWYLKPFRSEWLDKHFEKPCKWHDIAYIVGGSETDRQAADDYFYVLSNKVSGRAFLKRLASIFTYELVDEFGDKSFDYRDCSLTLCETRQLAQTRIKAKNNSKRSTFSRIRGWFS